MTSPWVICSLCQGNGSHVNPAIDAGGLGAEDFSDDDFREAYMAGVYDVPCVRCGGSGKIREDDLRRLEAEAIERARERRESAREDGDWEAYRDASDPRWG